MELAKISANAEGYYSGQTYIEEYFLRKESYDKLKEHIDKIEIYVYELDGKHSEVEADVDTEIYTEEELLKEDISCECDDSNLYFRLQDIYEENDMDFKNEIKEVREYLKTLDTIVTFEITVRKSQVEKVREFIKSLE